MFKTLRTKAAKKWTSLVVTFMMTLTMVAPGLSVAVKAAGEDKVFDIIEITDFHGALVSSDSKPLPIASVLAKNIKDVKASNPNRTLVIGGGDLYQGSPVSNVLRGVPVQKVMDNLGMDLTALGNHEFDWTMNTLMTETMKNAKYPIVCANLYKKGTSERVFDAYKVIEKDGVKIAFIGAITTEAPSIILPANVADYDFKDVATEVNTVAAEITAGKLADVIIAVIHEGSNSDGKTGEIFNIADKLTTNVKAVLGGHSHTVASALAPTSKIPVYIANSNGKGYINLKMTVKADGTVSFPAPSTANDYIALDTDKVNGYKATAPIEDPEVKKIVNDALAEVGPTFNEKIGTASIKLTRTQLGYTSYAESALGNWVTDVIRAKAGADVGLQNNGGIRTDINAGDITVGMVYYLMPFDNEIATVNMTKAQLKVVLEQAFGQFQDPKYPDDSTKKLGGKGIQLSGIKVKYDSTKSYGSKVVEITRANGDAIADDTVLKVATNDFVGTGGDGFLGFLDPAVKATYYNSHDLVRDALIADVRAAKTIVAPFQGRIQNTVNRISILATSDIHGNVLDYDYATGKAPATAMGLARVNSYVKMMRANNPGRVMLIDNGDTIQGTPLSYYYDMIDTTTEYPMMKVMGAMKYDTWTYGNHEFNYGLNTLQRISQDARNNGIAVLSANTYNVSGTNYVDSSVMKEFNINGKTVKVAVIGLTTKTIPNWEDVPHYKGLEFKDLVDEADKWVKKVKADGADVVIVSAHSGMEQSTDTIPENQIKAIAGNVNNIDAIVSGHIHKTINDTTIKNPSGKVVPILEPNRWGTFVSQIDVLFDETGAYKEIVTNNIATENFVQDTEVVDVIKPYHEKTLEYIQTKLGTSTGEFAGKGQLVVPTAIMELINKVQMEGANTELSIAAPLSDKAYIPSGDVTIQNIMSVYVFENFLFGVKMNGKQLKNWMEYSVKYYKQVSDPSLQITLDTPVTDLKDATANVADYNLDQLYGATYDVDLTQPACTVENGVVVSGNRIKNLKVNGKLVKDTDEFTVAINNYRFNGGGGFVKAAGLTIPDANGKDVVNPALVTYDSGKALGDDGQVRSMMMAYIQDHGTISPTCSNNWKLSAVEVAQEVEPVVIPVGDATTIATPEKAVADKIAAKVATVTGKSQNVYAFSTTDKVAANTTMKIFVGKDWAGKTVSLNVYNKDKNIYETVQAGIVVDADGYITVKVNPSTTYFVTDATSLPKTGSPIDMGVLVNFGAAVSCLGALALILEEKKRKQNNAA